MGSTGSSSRSTSSLLCGKTSTGTQTPHSTGLHGGDESKNIDNRAPGNAVRSCHNMALCGQAVTKEITQNQEKTNQEMVNKITQKQGIMNQMIQNEGINKKITQNQTITNEIIE